MLLKPFDNRGPDDTAPARSSDQNAAPGACSKTLKGVALRARPEINALIRSKISEPYQGVKVIEFDHLSPDDPLEAEPYLRAAIAAAPNSTDAPAWLTQLGLAELFLDRPGHGADFFRRALAQQSSGAAAADVGLKRSLNLAAALALNGTVDEARTIVDGLRRQHPALSTGTLADCDCSREPGFRTGYEVLRRGALLAGVPETR